MPPTAGPGVAVSGPVARQQDSQREGIALDDGTWVDVGRDGRWRPSPGERARAAVLLGVFVGVLAMVALLLSVGGDDDDEIDVAAEEETTTTTEPEVTTTTLPPDPSSIGGEPASITCVADDRGGAELRDRESSAVLVLNATRVTGHAAEVVEYLEHLGYPTTVPGNGGRLQTSEFRYVPGYCAEAERLAIEMGLAGSTLEPLEQDTDLPVPLGRARIVATVGADTL